MGMAMTKPLIKNLIGRVRKNKRAARAARAARTYEQVRVVFGKITTWNFHNHGFDDNLSIQIFNSLHLI